MREIPARGGQSSERSADSPFASAVRNSVPSPPAGLFLCRQRKRRKKPPEGTSSEHTSLTPFPQNRDTAKTPYRSVAPPLQIETHRFDLRRTFRRNLQAATKGSCAVFRRIRTRNPSPTTKGAPPPLDSRRGFYGGRGTKDESFLVKKVIGFGYGFESFGAGRTKSFELYGDLMSDNYEYSSVDHVEVYIQGYSWW